MPESMKSLLVAGFFLVVPTAASAQLAPRVPDLDDTERSEVDAGEILVEARVEGSVSNVYVVGVVDHAVEDVWDVVSDFAGQSNWIPDMYGARVVARDGEVVVGEGATSVPFPFTDRQWQIRIREREDVIDGVPTYISMWEDVPGVGNMNDNDGYWLLQPFEGAADRTLVAYRVRVDSGITAPDNIERSVQRRLFPGFIRGLRAAMSN